MNPQKKYFFTDFGCRLNQFETRVMENSSGDLQRAQNMEEADFIVINTCTVTGRADMKNRQAIRKARSLNPNAHIIVTGCYATTDELSLNQMKEVDTVFTNQNKFQIPDFMAGRQTLKSANLFPSSKQTPEVNARAYLKIQDGCDKRCSYCKIPLARGRGISRETGDTIKEIESLVQAGFHEIILTGVNIGHYKSNGIDFNNLLKIIKEIPGDFFYRISSVEPECVNREFLEIIASEKFASFLHLPLQSGSDNILKLMKRGYDSQKYLEVIDLVKFYIPGIHIGTDIMIGFPGETEGDFYATLELIEKVEFANIHFFPYSKRPGSKIEELLLAGENKDIFEVNGKTIRERVEMAMEIQKKARTTFIEKTSGNKYRAIIDTLNGENARIVTENYLSGSIKPGIHCKKGDKIYVTYDRHLNYCLA